MMATTLNERGRGLRTQKEDSRGVLQKNMEKQTEKRHNSAVATAGRNLTSATAVSKEKGA